MPCKRNRVQHDLGPGSSSSHLSTVMESKKYAGLSTQMWLLRAISAHLDEAGKCWDSALQWADFSGQWFKCFSAPLCPWVGQGRKRSLRLGLLPGSLLLGSEQTQELRFCETASAEKKLCLTIVPQGTSAGLLLHPEAKEFSFLWYLQWGSGSIPGDKQGKAWLLGSLGFTEVVLTTIFLTSLDNCINVYKQHSGNSHPITLSYLPPTTNINFPLSDKSPSPIPDLLFCFATLWVYPVIVSLDLAIGPGSLPILVPHPWLPSTL